MQNRYTHKNNFKKILKQAQQALNNLVQTFIQIYISKYIPMYKILKISLSSEKTVVLKSIWSAVIDVFSPQPFLIPKEKSNQS